MLLMLSLVACDRDEVPTDTGIVGIWVDDGGDGLGNRRLRNHSHFDRAMSGLQFQADGTLIVRQNSSWCGSPIVYVENLGTWRAVTDSTVQVQYPHWDGPQNVIWRIVLQTPTQLVLADS